MNKYLLAGLCVLAFAAGALAHLFLNKGRTPEAAVGKVAEQREDAGRGAAGNVTNSPATTTGEPVEAKQGRQPDTAEAASAADDSRAGEAPKFESGMTVSASRKVRRSARRASGAKPHEVPVAPAARAQATAPRKGSMKSQTASGAKKAGKAVGKAFKKVGSIFHD